MPGTTVVSGDATAPPCCAATWQKTSRPCCDASSAVSRRRTSRPCWPRRAYNVTSTSRGPRARSSRPCSRPSLYVRRDVVVHLVHRSSVWPSSKVSHPALCPASCPSQRQGISFELLAQVDLIRTWSRRLAAVHAVEKTPHPAFPLFFTHTSPLAHSFNHPLTRSPSLSPLRHLPSADSQEKTLQRKWTAIQLVPSPGKPMNVLADETALASTWSGHLKVFFEHVRRCTDLCFL